MKREPIRTRHLAQYMHRNNKPHANSARQDQNTLETQNPSCSSHIHRVHTHQDPNITEIHKTPLEETILSLFFSSIETACFKARPNDLKQASII